MTVGGNRVHRCLTDGDELCDVLLREKCGTFHNQHWRLSLVSHSAGLYNISRASQLSSLSYRKDLM